MVREGNICPVSDVESYYSYNKKIDGFRLFSHKTHSVLTLLLVYCCLSCVLDPWPADIALSWYLALFHQAYGETISVWLIVAALLYRRIYHPAALRGLCAVSSNLWLLHLLRGSDHLNTAQCWVSGGVQVVCRICDHSCDMLLMIPFAPLKWIPGVAVHVNGESAASVHIQ